MSDKDSDLTPAQKELTEIVRYNNTKYLEIIEPVDLSAESYYPMIIENCGRKEALRKLKELIEKQNN